MDRPIVYVGQIPQDTDLLLTNKNAMVALGFLMQAVLGTSVSFDGLACTPHTPANLTVNVGPGVIHSLQNIDGTAYGSIAADTTNQIMKQGINPSTLTLSCPAPATTGQSINYLIQAAYQDVDSGAVVLPYYNASNPSVPYSGPNGSGVSQNTVRKGVCLVGVKAGIPATTGSQTTPAPDAGYTGLYVVTVANGQTTIISGNITQLSSAPFIPAKLPAMLSKIQSGSVAFAQDTSGAANTITIALDPVPASLTNGQRIAVKVANSSTGATVMNVNGLGNVACKTTSGADFGVNTIVANGIYTFAYDANGTRFQLQGFTAATATGLVPSNNLSDVTDPVQSYANITPSGVVLPFAGGTAPIGWLMCAGQAVSRTTYSTLFTAIGTAYGAGDGSTTFNLPDLRGRAIVGKDNMGGSAANRVTNGGSGIAGTTLGASGGEQSHTLTAAESAVLTYELQSANPANTSSFNTLDGGVGIPGATTNNNGYKSSSSTGSLVQTNAGGGAHNNMPPSLVMNYIIKS